MNISRLSELAALRWHGKAMVRAENAVTPCEIEPALESLADVCGWLFGEMGQCFAGLVVEEDAGDWVFRYLFYGRDGVPWTHVVVRCPATVRRLPSISHAVHAVDWHEREAEDLFGIEFEGHPRLGDFVLHDDVWQEGLAPMRHAFSARAPVLDRHPNQDWRPRRIVEAPGAFVMPIGPVFAGGTESVFFELETVGEDVIRAFPRLFYKYRGIEKIAEGQVAGRVLLLAERMSATTAFAHALGFCHAVESVCCTVIPPRARLLRVFIAELERLRHHVGAIAGICASTALVIAESQAAMLEEELLRVSGTLTAHRYLFGLVAPGGLARDLDTTECAVALRDSLRIARDLGRLERMLRVSSSFLDRLEEVGHIAAADACSHGLVGPIARASGVATDLRKAQPYDGYEAFTFDVPVEQEGDGYARLRVLFREAQESTRIMEQAASALQPGPVHAPVSWQAGAAVGWVEAPRGAAFHWVRLAADGVVERYRIIPPSFINWHGFHLSVENFTFQDFPIILSTLDLSVAENDR